MSCRSSGSTPRPATLATLAPAAPTTTLWVGFDPGVEQGVVAGDVAAALPADTALAVRSGAAERSSYEQVIDTMLAVVVGLLGVAVVIALVGVANTLSLSVLERRRESATLRALGLTRRQLRATLALEGVLIAGVGAVVGSVLGLVYGWAGAATVLGQVGPLTLGWPVREHALLLVVAVVAALGASVLPARSAVRTPPVAALAVD